MTAAGQVRVRELVAWGVDENPYRPRVDLLRSHMSGARKVVVSRESIAPADAIVPDVPASLRALLDQQLKRNDLHEEMKHLDWTLGIVDLRQLLAFQRRLVLDSVTYGERVPSQDDWPALTALAFAPPIPVRYRTIGSTSSELHLQSENPNLQLRASIADGLPPFAFHGGSPFVEVGEFRGRCFLRDGYHRAFRLLRTGVAKVPAVIIKTRTLAELGAVQPWFFSEPTLFAPQPPRVIDFLDDELTVEYNRPHLLKTIRVRIEESVEPALSASNQENKNEHLNNAR